MKNACIFTSTGKFITNIPTTDLEDLSSILYFMTLNLRFPEADCSGGWKKEPGEGKDHRGTYEVVKHDESERVEFIVEIGE